MRVAPSLPPLLRVRSQPPAASVAPRDRVTQSRVETPDDMDRHLLHTVREERVPLPLRQRRNVSKPGRWIGNSTARRSIIQVSRIPSGSPDNMCCHRPETASRSPAERPSPATGASAPTVTNSPLRVRQVRSFIHPQYGISWASAPDVVTTHQPPAAPSR